MAKITLTTWWTNFLTGVLATSIGVGLTFGVNNLVERNRQKQAQRQAAMMAIYDIDEMARKFEICKTREDAFYHVAMYLFSHPEELMTTSMDSLWMASEYLHYDPATTPEWVDESTEKVFTTSMDAMTNIGDITFYRNVQKCYHLRRDLLNQFAQSATFRKPVTDEFITAYRKTLSSSDINHVGMMEHDALARFVQLMFRQPEVVLYLQKFHTRNNEFDYFSAQIHLLNQENKFIMNISDADMKHYIETYVNKVVPATEKLILGTWESIRGPKTTTWEFRKDGTATYNVSTEMQLSLVFKEENINVAVLTPLSFTAEGRWELWTDTLVMQLDSATTQLLTYDFNLGALPKSFIESKKDSIDIMVEQHKQSVFQFIKQTVSRAKGHKTSVSKTGNMMFWEDQRTLPWGEIKTEKTQFTKIVEK